MLCSGLPPRGGCCLEDEVASSDVTTLRLTAACHIPAGCLVFEADRLRKRAHMGRDRISPTFDEALDEAWREHRQYLLDLAFRMLGRITDAEDVVQEAFTRLMRSDTDAIDDVKGWLIVVVSRLCLDQLRSARSRHEETTAFDPEARVGPGSAGFDPADRVTLDDSVPMALVVLLERLSPAQRPSLLLHAVFPS